MEEDKELSDKLFNAPAEIDPEVVLKTKAWSAQLLNPESCLACRQTFNLSDRMPRNMVQCGHTLCNKCVIPVTRHSTSRCPICLAILTKISYADRLPPNPQAFSVQFVNEKLDIQLQMAEKDDELDGKRLQSSSRQVARQIIEGVMRFRDLRLAQRRTEALLLRRPPKPVLQTVCQNIPRQRQMSNR